MPLNTNLLSPTVGPISAFDADLGQKTLNGIYVNAAGRLVVVDIEGQTATFTVSASPLPVFIRLQIRTVVGDGSGNVGTSTGTNIALANLVGVR